MSWDYRKFIRHPVAAENSKMRGRNPNISHYHYRIDPTIGKGVCAISWISCSHPSSVDKLDKYWLPNIAPSSQPRYVHVDNFYYKKILEHYNDWIIMELLDSKTPKVELYKICALILVGI